MDQEGKLCQFSKSTLAKALTFSHRPEAGVFDIAMPMLIVQIHSGLYTHRASFAAPPPNWPVVGMKSKIMNLPVPVDT